MPKIGELAPERTNWGDNFYLPVFDAGDPANPDPKVSLGSLRVAAAVLEQKTMGAGTKFSASPAVLADIGAVPANVTAEELGSPVSHKTVLTLAALSLGTSGDNAAKANGGKIYTFPAGVIIVRAAKLAFGVTIADATKTDNPIVGLGTTIASGAVSALSGTAAFENIFAGANIADVNGTVFTGTKLPTASPFALVINAGDSHDVFLNIADTWANLAAEAALAATGTVTLLWEFVG